MRWLSRSQKYSAPSGPKTMPYGLLTCRSEYRARRCRSASSPMRRGEGRRRNQRDAQRLQRIPSMHRRLLPVESSAGFRKMTVCGHLLNRLQNIGERTRIVARAQRSSTPSAEPRDRRTPSVFTPSPDGLPPRPDLSPPPGSSPIATVRPARSRPAGQSSEQKPANGCQRERVCSADAKQQAGHQPGKRHGCQQARARTPPATTFMP